MPPVLGWAAVTGELSFDAPLLFLIICGIQVNPAIIEVQMQSGIIFGLSGALFGEVTIKDGRVEQTNFGDYRILRINEALKIDVHLVKNSKAPGGIGEPGTSCVMPALTNAIYAATGCTLPGRTVDDRR